MEMPKPGEAHARLQKLVGRWSGRETLHPAPWDPAGGPATAVVDNRSVLGGFAVLQEYQQERNGVPNFTGHGLFWWDPAKNQYVMHWIDSMGGTAGEYRGDFEGDVLRLVSALPQGGFSRCSFDCGSDGRYAFALEVSFDGQGWAPAIEGDYILARVADAPARSPRTSARTGRGAKKVKAARPAARVAAKTARSAKSAKSAKTAKSAKSAKGAKHARTAGRRAAPAQARRAAAGRGARKTRRR
jgi:hypothetical protein